MCMGPPAYLCLHIERNWVYPHVYGATFLWGGAPEGFEGLSPCVWGHSLRPSKFGKHCGSIRMCIGPPLYLMVSFLLEWILCTFYRASVLYVTIWMCYSALFYCVSRDMC